jgi:hypothetical protein
MIIDIDPAVITPEAMTIIAWLKDTLSKPGTTVVEVGGDDEPHAIYATKSSTYRHIVAPTYWAAVRYIDSKGYDRRNCTISLCDPEAHEAAKSVDVVVEFTP